MLKLRFSSEFSKCPSKGSKDSVGLDLYSVESVTIKSHNRGLVNTGIVIEGMTEGHYARVAPRSGLAVKGVDVGAGVVDPDYRGDVKVVLINNKEEDFEVNVGDRIAQLILERCTIVREIHLSENGIVQVLNDDDMLVNSSTRGTRGFGSSGV